MTTATQSVLCSLPCFFFHVFVAASVYFASLTSVQPIVAHAFGSVSATGTVSATSLQAAAGVAVGGENASVMSCDLFFIVALSADVGRDPSRRDSSSLGYLYLIVAVTRVISHLMSVPKERYALLIYGSLDISPMLNRSRTEWNHWPTPWDKSLQGSASTGNPTPAVTWVHWSKVHISFPRRLCCRMCCKSAVIFWQPCSTYKCRRPIVETFGQFKLTSCSMQELFPPLRCRLKSFRDFADRSLGYRVEIVRQVLPDGRVVNKSVHDPVDYHGLL
jgi:hypothetical protein